MTQVVITPPGRHHGRERCRPAATAGHSLRHRRIARGPQRETAPSPRPGRSAPIGTRRHLFADQHLHRLTRPGREGPPAGRSGARRAGSQSERPSFSRGRTSRSMEMGETALSSAGAGVSLKVERIEGNRLHVASPDRSFRGWIGIDQVISLDTAMDYFDRAIARNPKDVDALRMTRPLVARSQGLRPRHWPTSNRRSDWRPIEPPRTRN